MGRGFPKTVLLAAAMSIAIGSGLLVACGDDVVMAPPEMPAHIAAAQAGAASGPGVPTPQTAADPEPGENPRWHMVAPWFDRFARRPVSVQKDIFRSRLDKYVERPEIRTPEEGVDEPIVDIAERTETLDPLKRYPADRFVPVLIMTGTGLPRAMLRDPKGTTHIIGVNTEVGNENGVVTSITQHEIVILHDDPKPVRLSLRPEVFDLAGKPKD